MKDRSDDPSHHEETLLTRSYISLPGSMETDKSAGSVETTGTRNTRDVETDNTTGTGNTGVVETDNTTGTANTGDVETDNTTGNANRDCGDRQYHRNC